MKIERVYMLSIILNEAISLMEVKSDEDVLTGLCDTMGHESPIAELVVVWEMRCNFIREHTHVRR